MPFRWGWPVLFCLICSEVLARDGDIFQRAATGKEMLAWCRVAMEPGKEAEAALCAEYASSMRRRGDSLHVLSFMQGSVYCMPKDVKMFDLIVAAARYLDNHPELLHRSAATLVGQAYAAEWPCRTKAEPAVSAGVE